MFFIAYAFKGHVHAFAGQVIVVSYSACRTSAIFKYFFPKQVRLPHIEVSMIRKYHNHKTHTNSRHQEEEQKNTGCHKS